MKGEHKINVAIDISSHDPDLLPTCGGIWGEKYIATITIVVIVNMPYKTINVNPETYDRFVYYKHANMTFDEVLNEMMDKISEEEFYKHILEEHREEIRKMKEGDHLTEDDLDDFLDSDDQ